MNIGLRRTRLILMVLAIVCIVFADPAWAQAGPQQKQKMAEDVFKNVEVLRGIPVDEFMGTMGFFSASLGLNCIDCHSSESANSLEHYADDTPIKETARKMILMMLSIDQTYFAGQRVVTCYSCHRGAERPKISPSLAEMYGTPPPPDANEIDVLSKPTKGPSAADIIDKYIQAIGGNENLSKLSSFVGRGTYEGYDTESESNPKVPFQLFAEAPGKRASVVHLSEGDLITVYDGHSAWKSGPKAISPLPFMELTGGELDGAEMDADFCFPMRLKQDLRQWSADFPEITVNNHRAHVIQGYAPEGSLVKLYFDKDSSLLLRQVLYANTPVGLIPRQVDYSDYRDVSRVKLPFHWVLTWTDGQSTAQIDSVQPNTAISNAEFAQPAQPTR